MTESAVATTIADDPALVTAETASLPAPLGGPGREPHKAAPSAALLRRQTLLVTAGCIAAALLALLLWRADRAATAALHLRQARAAAVAADMQAIARLQRLPAQAAETGLPASDLLQRVSRAMQTAGLRAEALASTLPQPPRRLPNSDHAEIVHRLLFEGVSLEALTHFGYALTAADPALRLSGVQLRAGRESSSWDADVSVSYWVLAPQRSLTPQTGSP